MIQGEPGIGKSRLVQWVLDRAAESTSRTTVGAAEPYSRAVPYRPWIAPLNQILRLEGISPEARRERVRSTLPPNEDVDTVFSLLDSVLVLGAEIDKTTSRLTSQSRAERIVALLTHLVCESVKTAPAVIVLEDAHWMDSPSWELAAKILRAACPVLFVVTTRPTSTSGSSSSRKRFLQSPNLETLTLGPLTRDEVLAIACERLDVDALPAEISGLIVAKAEGHPLFAEQLAYALRDRGLIRIETGECSVKATEQELASFSVADTVQSVVTSRIDLLTPSQQLTLKVASVIGRRFDTDTLKAIHPLRPGELSSELEAMCQLQLLHSEGEGYSFSHAITQDVSESLLPIAQRRELHAAMAGAHPRPKRRGPNFFLRCAGASLEPGEQRPQIAALPMPRESGGSWKLRQSGSGPVARASARDMPRAAGRT